jgi:intracellular septation protein
MIAFSCWKPARSLAGPAPAAGRRLAVSQPLHRVRYDGRPLPGCVMQLLFDFLPIIAFFVAYKVADIYVATGVLIAAVILQSSVQWIRTRKFNTMHLVSAFLVLLFGGLTLAIHDKAFIMWKPTIVNWLFAAGFLASQLRVFGGKPLVQRLMSSAETQIEMNDSSWRHLNHMWVAYFVILGIANLVVFRNFDEATWVNFKLFGMLGLTLLFIVLQGMWVASKAQQGEAPQ